MADSQPAVAKQAPSVYDPSLRPVMKALLLPLFMFCLVLLVVATVLFGHLQNYALEHKAESSLAGVEYRLRQAIRIHTDTLISIEQLFAERPELKTLLVTGDREGLLKTYLSYFNLLKSRLGVTHFYFHDTQLNNIVRLHQPNRFGDYIDRVTATESRAKGEVVSGMELGILGTFTLRVVMPVKEQGKVIGYLELGTEFKDIIAMAVAENGIDWAAFVYKRLMRKEDWQAGIGMLGRDYDWDLMDKLVLVNTSEKIPPQWIPLLNKDPDGYRGNLPDFSGRKWYAGRVSLPDIRGRDVGHFQFFVDVTDYRDKVAITAYFVYAGVVVLILGAALFIYLLLRRSDLNISRRLNHLHQLAFTDPLTLLPNRDLFADRLSHALSMALRSGRNVAVLFLDLDDFKSINDSLGHSAGDELLQEVGRRLQSCVRNGDTLARQGGDEFALVVENLIDQNQVVAVADHIIEALKETITIDGQEVSTGVSIGISVYPENGRTAQDLMRNADAAMYMAKASGKNRFAFYTSDLTANAVQRITLLAELRRALTLGDISLNYQPIIDGINGHQVGFESLARWHHPVQGHIAPRVFIDLAEECGLINELGDYLIARVCRQIHDWLSDGLEPGYVSVNLSVAQLEREDFADFLQQQLLEADIPASRLVLEITESALMKDMAYSVKKLRRLGEMGISVWIDDFGTGYSSLAYLKQLPIDVLKIDASFVRDIPGDADDMAIVKAITVMSQTLNIEVLAEGVETEEQASCLRGLHCHLMQGYWFSQPLSAAVVTEMLQQQQKG